LYPVQKTKKNGSDAHGGDANVQGHLHAHAVQVGANDWADEEDGQLEDAEHQAVLGGNAAFLLCFMRIKWRL